jgi:RNA polymerase sigma-70 factor, ECF subfamily
VSDTAVRQAIDAIWRIESPKVIAGLARMLRDVGRAEELAQDAFVCALAQWPDEGIPRNPGAWLMTTAKRRAIDQVRRAKAFERKAEELYCQSSTAAIEPDFSAAYDEIDDDLLRLMFVACHPLLSKEARAALTLRLLGGLTTAEIARAFLVSETAISARIVRAKRALAEARVPFEVPEGAERLQRLESILEVIYLIFNEGYAASAGDDVLRPELVEDALRLGRVLAALMSNEAEVHGLVALMELQASRMPARTGPSGEPVLLRDQDRRRWNRLLIARGLAALRKAEKLAPTPGPYALQAAIAACHARALRAEQTDWARIAALYGALGQLLPTPVVELNRAVAVSMASGAGAGLEIVDGLCDNPLLKSYRLLPSVRAEFLFQLGRLPEARAEFERAAALAQNRRDRDLLLERASSCAQAELSAGGRLERLGSTTRIRTGGRS